MGLKLKLSSAWFLGNRWEFGIYTSFKLCYKYKPLLKTLLQTPI